MENITIKGEEIQKVIEENLVKNLTDVLTSTYSNPLRKAIEGEVAEQDGAIKKLVKESLSELLTSEDFKSLLSKELMAKIVEKGLRG